MPYTFSEVSSPENAEKIYKKWDGFGWTRENFYHYTEWASKRKEEIVTAWIRACQPTRMLDVGCGSAILLKKAEKFVPCVVGLDMNLALLQAIRERKDVRQILEASAYALPFSDGAFDFLLCSEVIEHLAFPERALREMVRVLSAKGHLLATTPHLHCYDGIEAETKLISRTIALVNTVRKIWRREALYPYGYNTHLQKKTPSQWKALFERFFEVETIEPIFIFPYIPALFPFLRRVEDVFLQKFFSKQAKLETALKSIYPFVYLGQLQLYLLSKRRRG